MSDTKFKSGLPADVEDNLRTEYTTYCVDVYKRMKWKDDTLSEYDADDFRKFAKENFHAIPTVLRRELRDLLRSFGVYVPKGRTILIADALYEVAQKDIPWPANEKENPKSPGIGEESHQEQQKVLPQYWDQG